MTGAVFAKMVALGLTAGVLGGMFGIGGGLIMVPALVLIFGLDLKTATGTSLLAQLLPVGSLAVLEYWRRGEVQIVSGLWVALGLLGGAFLGARLTGMLPAAEVKRAYGIFLIAVGVYFLLWNPAKLAARKPATPAASSSVEDTQR
jgi:uncharacterized membrane protein YfcA